MAPFTSLYMLDDEWAAEIVNRTVHGVMHIGWVADRSGGYRGEMAVYVKPDGLLGHGYMAAIRPFRHLIVYPPLMRQIEKDWRTEPVPAGARRSDERVRRGGSGAASPRIPSKARALRAEERAMAAGK